jgi:hypothetical protein
MVKRADQALERGYIHRRWKGKRACRGQIGSNERDESFDAGGQKHHAAGDQIPSIREMEQRKCLVVQGVTRINNRHRLREGNVVTERGKSLVVAKPIWQVRWR